MKQDVTIELTGGKHIKFETGRIAKQAPGAAFTTSGDNAVLATATASPDPKDGIDFFPLTVEYREFTYAGGRIPGGFIKREGRPSGEGDPDLRVRSTAPSARSSLRAFRNETQVVAFVYSADKENDPDVLGINGASCALALSDIPFHGPVGAVRIGYIDGQYIVNPTYSERLVSLLNIMVVGTKDGIVMVESGAKEVAPKRSSSTRSSSRTKRSKRSVAGIEDLVSRAGKPKRTVHSSGARRGLRGRTQGQGRRPSEGRARHPEAPQVRELRPGQGDQGRAQKGAPRRRCRRAGKKLSKLLRAPARDHLPRPGAQRAHPSRPPRLRQDSRDHHRRPASCPASTAPPSSPVAKPRRSSPRRSAPPTTRSAWRATKASKSAASCCTTTSRRSPSVKLAA